MFYLDSIILLAASHINELLGRFVFFSHFSKRIQFRCPFFLPFHFMLGFPQKGYLLPLWLLMALDRKAEKVS